MKKNNYILIILLFWLQSCNAQIALDNQKFSAITGQGCEKHKGGGCSETSYSILKFLPNHKLKFYTKNVEDCNINKIATKTEKLDSTVIYNYKLEGKKIIIENYTQNATFNFNHLGEIVFTERISETDQVLIYKPTKQTK